MPKKRKKDRKAPRKRASVRAAPARHAEVEPLDWDGEDEQEKGIELLGSLTRRFPAPADGVKAVRAGERVEWTGSIDGSTMRHRVLLSHDGTAVVEQAVCVGGILERALLCAWHQAGEEGREALVTGVLAALDTLHAALRPALEADIREVCPDYTAPVPQPFREEPERHGSGVPLFGWRLLHPVGPDTTWEETVDTAMWNSSMTMCGWLDFTDGIPELQPAELARLLRRHDVPALFCAGCGDPITDRHPRWSGVWVTPDSDFGPLCGGPYTSPVGPKPLLGMLTDEEFGTPHRPA
ncbi:hypothetical protein AB0I49_37880 [Streptomyces sp. NPDC050617]|uniref:hypothetical protein n=1 Tax=Streptomyces sp. NPDC050617 TaxID=3154628 RepID=UPI003441A3A7